MRTRRLRIAIAVDPALPVPPRLYGGIERVVHFLAEGLTARGHDVVLFAHPDSRVSCKLVGYARGSIGPMEGLRNATAIARTVLGSDVDVVHSFGRLAYLAPLALNPSFKVMSYQRAITPRSVAIAARLFGNSMQFTACGRHMISEVGDRATWHIVQNGVPVDGYTFRPSVPVDAPVMFLGRIERIKGPHLAIEAARRAGRKLILAGNIPPDHQRYFDEEIRPRVDDVNVSYVGAVDDVQKNELLGRAAALLVPILWDEPFGIVMPEALACGTPVIGFRRASVPEIVDDGINGRVVGDVDEMAVAIDMIAAIDRRACRDSAQRRFSAEVIVSAYESIYLNGCAAAEPVRVSHQVRH